MYPINSPTLKQLLTGHSATAMGFDDDTEDHPFFHRKSKYDLNSKIMLTAIISLSIVVFFVSLLHIYARCVLRRQTRRRAALQRVSIITSVAQVEPPKTGLDPSIIASLPIFIFKQNDHIENNSIECTVCLSILENEETVRTLPNCKHIFHAECIDKWLGSHSTCPICRTEAEPWLLPEPREGVVGRIPPSAPPHDGGNSNTIAINMEGMIFSDCGLAQPSSSAAAKISGSSSRLGSFRRMLSREKSSRRIQVQSCGTEDDVNDLERVIIVH
ncbi:E3 ubiquitin-protein ligase ATL41-like [Lycium barbarum]|uniref:E3 ubiquitin-protein ligase ATL41-like n=1 Tax=Lycium barbarum TaxID=112863 RepID=UPI00293E930C|nr:E3 ubiquitin-protein ligase ATL41-like [Lycium barbarum]